MRFKTLYRIYRDYLSDNKWTFYLMMAASMLSVAFQLLVPLQIGQAINALVGPGQVDFPELTKQVGLLILNTALAVLTQYIQSQLAYRLSYRVMRKMREDLFRHIQELPLSEIDRRSNGDIVSRTINDVDVVGNGLLQAFNSLFSSLVMIAGIIIIMLDLNVKIALIVIVLTPISIIVAGILAQHAYRYLNEMAGLRGDLGAYVDEMAKEEYLVRVSQYEGRAVDRFRSVNRKLVDAGIRAEFAVYMTMPSSRVITAMVYAAVGIVGAFYVLRGQLTVGVLSSFLTYANQYNRPFNQISSVMSDLQNASASAERVFEFLDLPREEASRNHYHIEDKRGQVNITDLSFRYQPEVPLIEDFSLDIEPGDTVAIVGPTGAGKTTIINLLMRFYEPDGGAIQIDGVNTQDMARSEVRGQFGMVLQDSWIFEGTVRENIAYGKPDASRAEIEEAARLANLDQLIDQLDDGYDTMLTENGTNISAGQKQLICIARIMLTKPRMLILDEATSSLDLLTESLVQQSFDRLMAGRTSFVIAHRLSTIQHADNIIVLDHGHIVEQGNHEQLLNKRGFYYQLYQSQFAN